MIRLKQLLFEDDDNPNRTKVLFVGDQDTLISNSYARQLIKRKDISGKIVAKVDASLTAMYEMIQNSLTKKYEVVSFFYDPNVQPEVADVEQTLLILENIFQYVKNHHECTLVVIVPPFKHIQQVSKRSIADKEIRKWLLEQDIADVLIDLGKLERIEFSKQRNLININIHNFIKKQWLRDVLSIQDDVNDDDSDREETESVPFERSLFKPGQQDIHIKYLQQHLMSLGYDLNMPVSGTGIYDESTINAIKLFQRDTGIPSNGEYNYITRKLLKRNLDVETQDDEWRLQNILKPKKQKKPKISIEITNAQDIMEFFTDKGLSTAGAAGIAGNIRKESNFKTYILGDNGTSNGLAQWHNNRWTGPEGFEKWCTDHNYDPWSVNGQLEFLWWEMSTKYPGLVNVLSDNNITPENAAIEFANDYENPAIVEPIRAQYAREAYDDYDAHPWIPGI